MADLFGPGPGEVPVTPVDPHHETEAETTAELKGGSGRGLEPAGLLVDERAARVTSPVRLWTPRGIGWASVLLGFPGALVLAALNWRWMGRTRKAIVHVAAAVLGTWALFFVPSDGRAPGFGISVAVAYYLYRALRSDQSSFAAAGHEVRERGGLGGAIVGLLATALVVVSGAGIATAREDFGRPPDGTIAFGTRAGGDACRVDGQQTLFSPSEPIYLVAAMRQTVQPGARVVVIVEVNGQPAGSQPVSVQPPFDCLASGQSIGPLPPGSYVVRYRDDGSSESLDLANGAFTVSVAAPSP